MRFVLLSILIFLLLDCNNQSKDPYKNAFGVSEKYVAAIDTAHFTIINWADTIVHAGNIKEGDSVFAKFMFSNGGNTSLFILGMRPSCGCTIVNYPQDAIKPGKTEVINAKFSTNHTHGFTRKTILVTTNTSNHNKTLLIIEANVLAHRQ